MQKNFADNSGVLNKKKMAYPFEYFKTEEDYENPVSISRKEEYFSKLYQCHPEDEEIERTNELSNIFHLKNGEELTVLYLKADVILLADIFEKFIKVS